MPCHSGSWAWPLPSFMGGELSASLCWAWPWRIAWCNAWSPVGLDFATAKHCGGAGYTRSVIYLASVSGVRVLPAAKSCGEANTTCSAKAHGCRRYHQFRAMLFGAPESIAPPSKGLKRMQGVTPRTVRWLVLGGAAMATSFAAMRLLRSSAPEVAVARVQFGELESWITTNGVVEPREPYVIRAPVGAFVIAVQSVEGRKVRRGDSLLALDVAAQRADLARAREELVKAQNAARVLEAGPEGGEWAQVTSDFRKAEAEVLQLQRARDTTERLVAKQAANRDELDRAELALTRALATRDALARRQQELERVGPANADAARLAIERARETVSLLDAQVRSADVRAPIEGTVYALPVRVGNRVETGTTLAQVADLR